MYLNEVGGKNGRNPFLVNLAYAMVVGQRATGSNDLITGNRLQLLEDLDSFHHLFAGSKLKSKVKIDCGSSVVDLSHTGRNDKVRKIAI